MPKRSPIEPSCFSIITEWQAVFLSFLLAAMRKCRWPLLVRRSLGNDGFESHFYLAVTKTKAAALLARDYLHGGICGSASDFTRRGR